MRKAVSKRIKITKTGKLLRQKARRNHFNAKESGRVQTRRKKAVGFTATWEKKMRRYRG